RLASLSKGERKRMLLAVGLLTPHQVLLLDEPFDGLDLRQTRDVMALLKDYTTNGRTLILSIHQLVDGGRVCDRVVLLSVGSVMDLLRPLVCMLKQAASAVDQRRCPKA